MLGFVSALVEQLLSGDGRVGNRSQGETPTRDHFKRWQRGAQLLPYEGRAEHLLTRIEADRRAAAQHAHVARVRLAGGVRVESARLERVLSEQCLRRIWRDDRHSEQPAMLRVVEGSRDEKTRRPADRVGRAGGLPWAVRFQALRKRGQAASGDA